MCTVMYLRKILAIFLPGPVKNDTMGPCLMLQAIYMLKFQGILWFIPGLGNLSCFPGSDSIFDGTSGWICSILLQYHCSVTMLRLEAKQVRGFEALSISQDWKDLKGVGVWTPDSTQEFLKIKSVELN